MFTVNDTVYTLKFNTQKVKVIETVTKQSIVGEVTKNNGIMPYQTLESLFSFGLVDAKTNTPVKQSEATAMFDKVVQENGLITTNMAIVEKLQEDLGFMFR
ncbi:segregation and condensation protein B [Robertmurraya kyonggiensis]|uniref:Segregation and condensation protein B n=1 Tax=Robertmurraya kyonggiensis TaxID=1037680 RepID=A0A4U1D385_9BACI|nr:segregation and condensation protein B [Robertmurraya kyonggiensis]TKC15677.1 segregation and condensation protein B [Robertmurraya kyonggiensis]